MLSGLALLVPGAALFYGMEGAGGILLVSLGLVCIGYGGHLRREARLLHRANAASRVLASGARTVLVLRSFADDAQTIRYRWTSTPVPFLAVLTRACDGAGLAVALTDPRSGPAAEGPLPLQVRFTTAWQDAVVRSLREAERLIVLVGTGPGLAFEMQQIVGSAALSKCVFVMPPVSGAVAARRWADFRQWVTQQGISPPAGTPEQRVLAATASDDGHWRLYLLSPSGRVGHRAYAEDYLALLQTILRPERTFDPDALDSSQNWILRVLLMGMAALLLIVLALLALGASRMPG